MRMLTDGDRIRLAPYLAEIHATRAARPEAVRAADRARQHLTQFRRDTTLWDRWFNRDSPTGLAYREARKVRRDAAFALESRPAVAGLLHGRHEWPNQRVAASSKVSGSPAQATTPSGRTRTASRPRSSAGGSAT
jgi:hypothetical protein